MVKTLQIKFVKTAMTAITVLLLLVICAISAICVLLASENSKLELSDTEAITASRTRARSSH